MWLCGSLDPFLWQEPKLADAMQHLPADVLWAGHSDRFSSERASKHRPLMPASPPKPLNSALHNHYISLGNDIAPGSSFGLYFSVPIPKRMFFSKMAIFEETFFFGNELFWGTLC